MLDQLATIFAPLDADVLARQTEWALGRRDAVKALASELVSQRRAMGEHAYYAKMFEVAGGKTWYHVVNGASTDMIVAFVAKNCRAIADKRNATISNKLAKHGVFSLTGGEHRYSRDGFDGLFAVDTDAGRKHIEIRTIVAGGYNIQCAHQRTLVYVK